MDIATTIIIVLMSLAGSGAIVSLFKLRTERHRILDNIETKQLQNKEQKKVEDVLLDEDKEWLSKHIELYEE